MKHRLLGVGLGAAAALALAAPAQAQETDQYWFHCTGPSKIQNGATLPGIVPATGISQVFWNTTKPTASFQSGAGCGFVDAPGVAGMRVLNTTPESAYDAYWRGVHGKAIDKMTLELHNLVTSRVRQGATQKFLVKIATGTNAAPTVLMAEREVTATPVLSSTGTSEKLEIKLDGVGVPAGAADRTLTVTVHTSEATPQGWVFDASEVPAGVTFTTPPPPPPAG